MEDFCFKRCGDQGFIEGFGFKIKDCTDSLLGSEIYGFWVSGLLQVQQNGYPCECRASRSYRS